ncbi:MAG: hypothetical protein WC601_11475, partial [Desulfotomaculaceae bacterium]
EIPKRCIIERTTAGDMTSNNPCPPYSCVFLNRGLPTDVRHYANVYLLLFPIQAKEKGLAAFVLI